MPSNHLKTPVTNLFQNYLGHPLSGTDETGPGFSEPLGFKNDNFTVITIKYS